MKATSLKRLLGTPEVRAKLGIESRDGKLIVVGDHARVVRALKHVVRDLDNMKVKAIYTQDQRIAYANALPTSIAVPSLGKASASTTAASKSAGGTSRGVQRISTGQIDSCDLRTQHHCAPSTDIARELRKLSLSQCPNAVSVLFRVFVELSADSYIDREKLTATSKDEKLSKKLLAVTNDLVTRKKLTNQQASPVRLVCSRNSFLAPSSALMNEYVHSNYIFPAPVDLRSYWDSIQPFVVAVWAP